MMKSVPRVRMIKILKLIPLLCNFGLAINLIFNLLIVQSNYIIFKQIYLLYFYLVFDFKKNLCENNCY